jgi:hypothetical protein
MIRRIVKGGGAFIAVGAMFVALAARAQSSWSTISGPPVDARLLVVSADGQEADLAAIVAALKYQGTPYTLWIATQRPGTLTAAALTSGPRGLYEGVILATSSLAFFNGTSWASALSSTEWAALAAYERTYHARELSFYTYPNAEWGFTGTVSATSVGSTPLIAKLTPSGAGLFSYLNPAAQIPIRYAYTYQAPAAAGTTVLLTDPSGNALAVSSTTADGRERLAFTFDSAPFLVHSVAVSYGAINWVTRGLFLGERRVYVSPQIDDLFIDDDIWNTGGAVTYRMTSNDLLAAALWQFDKRLNPVTAGFKLTWAFNGVGTAPNDPLTQMAHVFRHNVFNWVNHTYSHQNLDFFDGTTIPVDYATVRNEIQRNIDVATHLRLRPFDRANLVTPDVSGLSYAVAMQAAFDAGVRYLVSDSSKRGQNNPSPNIGIYNALVPGILELPRYPTNLFYNVTTPTEWVGEYNFIYRSYWGRDFSYADVIENQSDQLLMYLLRGDANPTMYHQSNLRLYPVGGVPGSHSLLSDLLDRTFAKYAQLYTVPVQSPTMDALGHWVAQRMQREGAGVTATINPGQSVSVSSTGPAVVKVTGLAAPGAEIYAGQPIASISLAGGQTATVPLPR